jgi:hypothetical protein
MRAIDIHAHLTPQCFQRAVLAGQDWNGMTSAEGGVGLRAGPAGGLGALGVGFPLGGQASGCLADIFTDAPVALGFYQFE